MQEQSRRVTITEDTLCRLPSCRRPIGVRPAARALCALSVQNPRVPLTAFSPYHDQRKTGNTAILCYPNGVVVHLACGRNDLHTCPVTGETFSTPGETFMQ